MVKSTGIYLGELNCELTHGPSGQVISTDAPVDNQGRGQAFSPTDLVGAALGTCMATTMAIVARRKGVELDGTTVEVGKEMSGDAPRRISRLTVRIVVPLEDHPWGDRGFAIEDPNGIGLYIYSKREPSDDFKPFFR